MLTSHEIHSLTAVSELIWHKDIPLKFSTFAWRRLCNRLSTKDNLVICDILPYVSQLVSILHYIWFSLGPCL